MFPSPTTPTTASPLMRPESRRGGEPAGDRGRAVERSGVSRRVFAVRYAHRDARRGERNLDLPTVIRAKLAEQGVTDTHDTGLCTMCHPDVFFSHRRDSGVTGRQAGIVWRT